MRAGVDLTDNGPDDADELPGDGWGDRAVLRADGTATAGARAESLLGMPDAGRLPLRCSGGLGLPMTRRAGRDALVPRGFHPNRPDRTSAGWGDPAGAALGSRGAFAGNPAEDAHQLPRCVEAGAVTQLGQDGDSTPDRDATQADQGGHHRGQGPDRGGGVDRILAIRHPPRGLPRGLDRLRDDDLLDRTVEGLGLQPARRGLTPAAPAGIDAARPEEEGTEALTGRRREGRPVLPGPGPIRRAFGSGSGTRAGVRDPDRCSRARSVASRRSVLTRSVAPRGTSPGATTLP